MADDIQSRLDQAALARAEGRPADARNGYAQAAALSRETGKPLMRAHALRQLSDLDREADKPAEALAHAEQALALYRRHDPEGRLEIANALRLTALALGDLGRGEAASRAWAEARDGYAATGVSEGVTECDARLAANED
jgi:tetratricopeptide (TPR) repeat protein